MVSFDICAGNPGALIFVMQAYDEDMFRAERAFRRMQDHGITSEKLYMLWNDCCLRDTRKALRVMDRLPIDRIRHFINYDGGRGIPIAAEELAAQGALV